MDLQNLPISPVDLAVLAILAISGLLAYFRGFMKEVLSIFSWVGAFAATAYGYHYALPYMAKLIPTEPFLTIAAAAAVFVVTLIGLSILASLASGSIQESGAGPVDKALGFVFGLARGALVVSLLYIGVTWVWDESELPPLLAEAKSLPAAKLGADFLIDLAPADIREKARGADEDARRAVQQVEQANRIFDRLNNPSPGRAADADGASGDGESAYDAGDRQQLDSLIKQAE